MTKIRSKQYYDSQFPNAPKGHDNSQTDQKPQFVLKDALKTTNYSLKTGRFLTKAVTVIVPSDTTKKIAKSTDKSADAISKAATYTKTGSALAKAGSLTAQAANVSAAVHPLLGGMLEITKKGVILDDKEGDAVPAGDLLSTHKSDKLETRKEEFITLLKRRKVIDEDFKKLTEKATSLVLFTEKNENLTSDDYSQVIKAYDDTLAKIARREDKSFTEPQHHKITRTINSFVQDFAKSTRQDLRNKFRTYAKALDQLGNKIEGKVVFALKRSHEAKINDVTKLADNAKSNLSAATRWKSIPETGKIETYGNDLSDYVNDTE